MAAVNGESYELLSSTSYGSVFPRAQLLPVYTTCIFRCRFTSVKKENKHTHTHWHTFAGLCICIVSDKDSARGQGRECSAIWNATIIRSVVRRGMPDVRNAQVPLHWSRVHLLLLLLLHHLSPPPSSSFSSSILPSLLSFHFFSSYIKKRRWVCHIPHVYGYI